MKKKVVVVEGLIGGGKTTLTKELGKALGDNTLVLLEPDEKDTNSPHQKNPYLADYYEDPKRWSFILQCHQLQARFRMHQHAQWHVMQGHGHALLDRSYFGDTAFARLQIHQGTMTEREFETYSSIYHAMTASVLLPTVCVRVLLSPEVCVKRVERRMQVEEGRKCESAVTLEYLQALEQEIDHMVDVLRKQGVTIIDMPWDEDRPDTEARSVAVQSLAARINALKPPDFFLDLHRRTL